MDLDTMDLIGLVTSPGCNNNIIIIIVIISLKMI